MRATIIRLGSPETRAEVGAVERRWRRFRELTTAERKRSSMRSTTPAIGRTSAEDEAIYWAIINQTDGFAQPETLRKAA